MSDAADRRIADLEAEVRALKRKLAAQEQGAEADAEHLKKLASSHLKKVLDLEAKLVQRDVYEAEQRLPPEHAVLIKHLATVERCINEGPVTYHYAEESDCSFCGEWQGHTRDCAWLALQMDRGVTSVIDDIHAVALQENERRERQRMPREPANTTTVERMNQLLRDLWPPDRHFGNLANDMRDAAIYGLGNMRVEANPLVPPGTVYATNLSDFRGIPALRQGAGLESPIAMQMRLEAEAALRQEPTQLVQSDWHVLTPEERYEDSGGVAGSAPSAVAPPDDEDVP